MIYYIKNEVGGAYMYPNKKYCGNSALSVLKNMCMKYLFTLEGYLKSTKKILEIRYKIPVVMDSNHIFFSSLGFKAYDNIWINYAAIKEIYYENEWICFYFDPKHSLRIKISTKSYQRIVITIFKILKYKECLE